jgi:enoyl-CoA hydratase/carnithine racemase
MILLGDPVDAITALNWGLITRVTPPDILAQECANFARRVATYPARAMQYAKRAIEAAMDREEERALRVGRDYAARLSATEDLAEGVRSFLERRSPQFSDRVDHEE